MSCIAADARCLSDGHTSPNCMATPAWVTTAIGPLETVRFGSGPGLGGDAATLRPVGQDTDTTARAVSHATRWPRRSGVASADHVYASHSWPDRLIFDGFAGRGGAVYTGSHAVGGKTLLRRFNLTLCHPAVVHTATGSELVLTGGVLAAAQLRDPRVHKAPAEQGGLHQPDRLLDPQVRLPQAFASRSQRFSGRRSFDRADVVHHDNLVDRAAEARRRRST